MSDRIPKITMETLIERYDILLFDAYGVLVHSTGALPGAIELIDRLNQIGKTYYILTNDASKLPETAATRYQDYGLDFGADRIISSGGLLYPYFVTHHLTGSNCIVLGPVDSVRYVEQAGGKIVAPGDSFDVLVIADEAGYPFFETADRVFTSLCRSLDLGRSVHLVLPNPDLIYPKSDRGLGFTAGSIAAMFEAALSMRYPDLTDLRFVRLGKPHTALFEEAFSRSGTRNMVMIGDQLETDIKGAQTFGIDAVWIETGVMTKLLETVPDESMRPTYCLRSIKVQNKLTH